MELWIIIGLIGLGILIHIWKENKLAKIKKEYAERYQNEYTANNSYEETDEPVWTEEALKDQEDYTTSNSLGLIEAVKKLSLGEDVEESLKTIKSHAAKKGMNQGLACAALGDYYRDKDEKTSADWFLKGAKLGEMGSQSEMIAIYKEGIGVTQDSKKAIEMMKTAADNPRPSTLAHKQAAFCTTIGAAYLAGEGVKKDKKKAKEYFQKGCEKGDIAGCDALKKYFP